MSVDPEQAIAAFIHGIRLICIECGIVSPWETFDERMAANVLRGSFRAYIASASSVGRGGDSNLRVDDEVFMYLDEVCHVLPQLRNVGSVDYRVVHRSIDTLYLFIRGVHFTSVNPSKLEDFQRFATTVADCNEQMWRRRFHAPHQVQDRSRELALQSHSTAPVLSQAQRPVQYEMRQESNVSPRRRQMPTSPTVAPRTTQDSVAPSPTVSAIGRLRLNTLATGGASGRANYDYQVDGAANREAQHSFISATDMPSSPNPSTPPRARSPVRAMHNQSPYGYQPSQPNSARGPLPMAPNGNLGASSAAYGEPRAKPIPQPQPQPYVSSSPFRATNDSRSVRSQYATRHMSPPRDTASPPPMHTPPAPPATTASTLHPAHHIGFDVGNHHHQMTGSTSRYQAAPAWDQHTNSRQSQTRYPSTNRPPPEQSASPIQGMKRRATVR